MKDIAILALLWEKHVPILMHYLQNLSDGAPRTLYLLNRISPAAQAGINRLGHRVVILAGNIVSTQVQRAIKKKGIKMLSSLRSEFAAPGWQSFCDGLSVPPSETAAAISHTIAAQFEIIATINGNHIKNG